MLRHATGLIMSLSTVSLTMLSVPALGEDPPSPLLEPPAPHGYAETIYADYAAATGGKVLFELELLAEGSLAGLGERRLGDLLAVPDHRIDLNDTGLRSSTLRLMKHVMTEYGLHDLRFTGEDLRKAGYPAKMARYRKFLVGVAIDEHLLTHEALELCWEELDHCFVVDPVVVFLDSIAHNHRRAKAEEWRKQVFFGQPDFAIPVRCGLASNPSVSDRFFFFPARVITYSNVFGGVLIRKSLGSQQTGIRCAFGCLPSPYGFSGSSSCSAILGWTCACDNKFGSGGTGGTSKVIAETRCTHSFTIDAVASAELENAGSIEVDIEWTLGGGVDSLGGQILDTCQIFEVDGCVTAPGGVVSMALDDGAPSLDLPLKDFALSRSEPSDVLHQGMPVRYLMAEHALIQYRTGMDAPHSVRILGSSSAGFAGLKALELSEALSELPLAKESMTRDHTMLVVALPPHEMNSRHMSMPPLQLSPRAVPDAVGPGRVLVNASFGEELELRGLEVLWDTYAGETGGIEGLLREALSLERISTKNHRVEVFALVSIDDTVKIERTISYLPKCCCGDLGEGQECP